MCVWLRSIKIDMGAASLWFKYYGQGRRCNHLDGATGKVMLGEVPMIEPTLSAEFETLLKWADETKMLDVRANADTPEDSALARQFGATGIGLCRTEHMFMAQDRLPIVQEMIWRTVLRKGSWPWPNCCLCKEKTSMEF